MTDRYGRRTLSSMLKDWHSLRCAVATGEIENIQSAFDRCEEWIDFSFMTARKSSETSPNAPSDQA